MQHATITESAALAHAVAFPAGMKPGAKRTFARKAFGDAVRGQTSGAVDWRAVAWLLFESLPQLKVISVEEPVPTIEWTDYQIKSYRKIVWPSPVLVVEFADGRKVRAGAASLAGKPVNWGRAVRHAVNWYRNKIAAFVGLHGQLEHATYPFVSVPAIVSVRSEDGSQDFPVDVANAETAELREGAFDLYDVLLEAHRRDLHWSEKLHDGAVDLMRDRFKEAFNDHYLPGWRDRVRLWPSRTWADRNVVSLGDWTEHKASDPRGWNSPQAVQL